MATFFIIQGMIFKTIYPKYYPKEVVDFFCRRHSKEHILNGMASGNMGVLVYNDVIVGTGCFDGNHITGVYVLPSYQNQGYGSHIMNCLEKEIGQKYYGYFRCFVSRSLFI